MTSPVSELPAADTPHRIRLGARLDVGAATALQDEIRPLIADKRHLVFEGQDVERVSTAGIQLLLATEAALAAHDGRLTLVDPAPALCDALTDLGLEPALRQWRMS